MCVYMEIRNFHFDSAILRYQCWNLNLATEAELTTTRTFIKGQCTRRELVLPKSMYFKPIRKG